MHEPAMDQLATSLGLLSFAVGSHPCPGLHRPHTCACVQVVEGFEVIEKIEGTRTDRTDKPLSPIVIKDSGEL